MLGRSLSIFVVLFWLASMSWLVAHDVVPAWTAQDLPKFVAGDWLSRQHSVSQARIESAGGKRVGTVWTEYIPTTAGLSRQDIIWLSDIPRMPPLPEMPPMLVRIDTDFTTDGKLDSFALELFGYGEPVSLQGERYSGYLAFRLDVGTARTQLFKVDASVAGLVADAFHPFPPMPSLEVGQSWRMYVVNPLAVLTGAGAKLMPLVVNVTGTQMLQGPDGAKSCFVLEADKAKAWVDPNGQVLRQEIELPYGGKFTTIAEPYDQALRSAAQARFPVRPQDSGASSDRPLERRGRSR